MPEFDPNSHDAMFAKILTKLEEHSVVLEQIKEQGLNTEDRLRELEGFAETIKGQLLVWAGIVSICTAILIHLIIQKFF